MKKEKGMTPKELKLMIIENYIDHFTSDENERYDMKNNASLYVDEDWVDEITQAGYEKIGNITSNFDPFKP